MNEVSPSTPETTRKVGARLHGEVLRRLVEVTQARAAACMGVDASTVSRTKEDLEKVCQLLAAIGLQFAPLDAMVISQAEIEAYELFAFKYLGNKIEGRRNR